MIIAYLLLADILVSMLSAMAALDGAGLNRELVAGIIVLWLPIALSLVIIARNTSRK